MLGAHSSQLMMSTDSSEKWNSLITPRLTVTCTQISIIRNWQPRMKRSQCWRRKWKERIQSLLFVVRNPTFARTLRWRQKNDSLDRWCWGWAEHQNGSEHSCHLGLTLSLKKSVWWDVPGGPVVKNLPAHAEYTVQSLVWEDLTCFRATKLMYHWARSLECILCNKESHYSGQARCCSEE